MNIAYLILAHHQPSHLARLVRALNSELAYFFIHIDQKVDMTLFLKALPKDERLIFLSHRVGVQWGGFSMVRGVLNLMAAAVNHQINFKYHVLLSGSCYPIKSRAQIEQRFSESNEQFIRVDRKLVGAERSDYFKLIEDYCFLDYYLLNPRSPIKRYTLASATRTSLSIISTFIRPILPTRHYPRGMTPYHGNLFCSLTDQCVRYILEFANSEPEFVTFHRFVRNSDEIFFHTIIKNSPFGNQIKHDFEKETCQDHIHHGNHFIDWRNPKEDHDFVLDERYFDEILASDALFARKFNEIKSKELLDLLDQRIF